MVQLAIKGSEYSDEVIEIFEMLGGRNINEYNGYSESLYYYIDEDGSIECDKDEEIPFPCIYFTLDEFLEKFPYKVGDKVYYDNKVCDVIEMLWNNNLNTISYGVYDGKIKNLAIAEELKPYKEETMEEKSEQITLDIPDGYEFFGINDDNKIVLTKQQPQYPKTYEECCELLGSDPTKIIVLSNRKDIIHEENKHCYEMYNLHQLLICRDAYWKLYGEQMGLGKPWKPDWENGLNKCCLTVCENRIIKSSLASANAILAFPTEVMRDAFYENFKELIEKCKELL